MQGWFGGRSGTATAKGPVPSGKPLLLIGFNESTRSWELNPEAVAALDRVSGPLCTVAVCGRARQGKSFLLNTLLGQMTGQDLPQGFQVSPTQHSCTRGLWMWSAPIPAKDADGKPCNLVLVDCEGVDAVDQGQQHSAQVFSLAVLLSSVFVYNQLGAIDAIALERLAMVCELAKRVKERSGGSRGGGQTDFHPAFVWLMRDFQLQLSSGGSGSGGRTSPLTPGQYLEDVLADVKGGGGQDEDNRNNMRRTIKAVFPDRDAATLLRPMLLEEDLHRLDTIPYSKLRPEFRKGMDDLMSLLRSKSQPLQFSGHLVSGSVYSKLAEAYVKALNQGAVPQLVTAWQGVARAESQKAYDAALSSFQAAFKEEGCADETKLYDAYQAALSSALNTFKESALGDASLVGEYEDKIRKVAEEGFAAARTKLRAASEAAAEALLLSEGSRLRALLDAASSSGSLAGVESEIRRFLSDYESRVAGPWKYRAAVKFMTDTVMAGVRDTFERVAGDAGDARRHLQEAEGRLAGSAAALAQAQAEAAQLAAKVSEATARERKTKADEAAARTEVDRLQSLLEGSKATAAEAAHLQAQLLTAQARADEAQAAAAAARQQVQATEGRAAQLQAQLEDARGVGVEVELLRSQLSEAQRAVEEARAQAARVAKEKDDERAVASRKLQAVTELQAELLRERQGHDATKGQLRDCQQQMEDLRLTADQHMNTQQQQFMTPDSHRGRGGRDSDFDATPSPSPVVLRGDLAAAISELPDDVSTMTVAALKEWVTRHALEDEDFMALASRPKAKKAEYVALVNALAGRRA